MPCANRMAFLLSANTLFISLCEQAERLEMTSRSESKKRKAPSQNREHAQILHDPAALAG